MEVPARAHPAGERPERRGLLALELVVLFGIVPLVLVPIRHTFAGMIIPTLLAVGGFCLLGLLRDPDFYRGQLWNAAALRAGLPRVLGLWALGVVGLGAATAWFEPELFLRLPRERPTLWLLVMVLYPVLSVYPQELIFRTFLFHRYRRLLPSRTIRVAASGLSFGLAHLFFGNWVAPSLSLLGGLLFASTYARHRSTLLVCLEHGLWGDLLFTVGLGWYFYGGSIG